MNVLPVIIRELRAQARQPFTFWLRMVGVVALLLGGAFFMQNFTFTPNRGGALFGYLHLMLLAAVWILVPLGAADCLSRERREGTLGLLFLTPLKPRDIVVAKGLTHGLRGVTLLVAVLPVLTIPFLIGGVSWQQATASAIINFTAINWALAASLMASATARNAARAMAMAMLLAVGALLLGAYLAGMIVNSVISSSPAMRGGGTVDYDLLVGLGTNGLHPQAWNVWTGALPAIRPNQMLICVIESTLISLFALSFAVLFAARRVRHSWQEEPPSLRVQQMERVFCRPVIGVDFLKRWMQRKLDRNPVGWLEQRHWSGRLVTWTWFAIIVSVQTTMVTEYTFFRGYQLWQNFMAWLLTFSLAASAAGSFRRERENGVLELLLVSPLTARQIIGGRLRGLWGQFLPSIVLLLGIWAYLTGTFSRYEGFGHLRSFLILYFALPVIGLYFSVNGRHFITAFLLTLFTAIATPMFMVFGVKAAWWLYLGKLGRNELPGVDYWSAEISFAQIILAGIFGALLLRRLETRSFALERGVV